MSKQTNWIVKAIAICLLLFCVAQPVSAYLVSSNLEWHDLASTSAREGGVPAWSYNDILSGAGGFTDDGWRYAGTAEIEGLFTTFIDLADPVPGIELLQADLGLTELDQFPTFENRYTRGFFDDGDATDGLVGLAEINLRLGYEQGRSLPPTSISGEYFIAINDIPADAEWGTSGHWLVRDVEPSEEPIPEPATLLLGGISLASFAGYGWRRRFKL